MSPFSIVILAFGMAADSFAVALARGASERPAVPKAVQAGLLFGVIEASNLGIGWGLGLAASAYITAIDHWIAFVLLGGVGSKMITEGMKGDARDVVEVDLLPVQRSNRMLGLVATAVGTSIDAAAIGVTLAFLDGNFAIIALSVGLATFCMASAGMLLGRVAGARLGGTVEVVAGLALIGLGTKILLEHLGYLG